MKLTFGRIALIVAMFVPIYFIVAALGVKFGLWPWQFGLGVLIVQAGLPILGFSLLLAAAALVLALVRRPRGDWAAALLALLIPVLGIGFLASVRAKSADIPPIHDIATNTVDPPVFSEAIMAARREAGANPVIAMTAPLSTLPAYQSASLKALSSRALGEVGRTAYPKVRPLMTRGAASTAFDAALKEVEAQGWSIVTQDPERRVIEATAETFWFGFKDDVAIRVRSAGTGAIVDVRSTSRVGLSDLGANAARIEAFQTGLAERLPPA